MSSSSILARNLMSGSPEPSARLPGRTIFKAARSRLPPNTSRCSGSSRAIAPGSESSSALPALVDPADQQARQDGNRSCSRRRRAEAVTAKRSRRIDDTEIANSRSPEASAPSPIRSRNGAGH
jgi:hypothetical protein